MMLSIRPSFGWISDPHTRETGRLDRVEQGVRWLMEQADLSGLIVSGDCGLAPYGAGPRFDAWIRGFYHGPLICALGNHDADLPHNAPYGQTTENPFSSAREIMPDLWGASENYVRDIGGVRFVVVQNISDQWDAEAERSCYHNCNTPGNETLNPDHSGMTDPQSGQRAWLNGAFSSAHVWKFLVCHNAPYAPQSYQLRPQAFGFRQALLYPAQHGMSGILSGNSHVGALGSVTFPGPLVSMWGLLCGTYASRSATPEVLPPECGMTWSDGGPSFQRIMHAALISFEPDDAHFHIRVWRAAEDDVEGREVYQGTFERNYGAE